MMIYMYNQTCFVHAERGTELLYLSNKDSRLTRYLSLYIYIYILLNAFYFEHAVTSIYNKGMLLTQITHSIHAMASVVAIEMDSFKTEG